MNKLLDEVLEKELSELLEKKEVQEMKIEDNESNKFRVVVTTE